MLNRKQLLPIAGALILGGCRIDVAVSTGGLVTTESGSYSCAADQSCPAIEVEDTAFSETFIAEPAEGYLFAGWKKVERGLCGGSVGPCVLETSWMAGEPELLAMLDADEAYKLEAEFLSSDQIRKYIVGDVVKLSGTLSQAQGTGVTTAVDVTANLTFMSPTYHLSGKDVIAARMSVSDGQGVELENQTLHVWQEDSGALFQLTDQYGNSIINTATGAYGIDAIPSPLEPFAESAVSFSALYGGHTYMQLTTGSREIEVGDVEVLSTQAGDLSVFPVTVSDSYTYLTSFDDFKRDERVEVDLTLWVSQVKGVIKLEKIERRYTPNDRLASTETLELKMTGKNY